MEFFRLIFLKNLLKYFLIRCSNHTLLYILYYICGFDFIYIFRFNYHDVNFSITGAQTQNFFISVEFLCPAGKSMTEI